MDVDTTESVTKGQGTWDIAMYITVTIICIVFFIIVSGNMLTIVAFIKIYSLRTVRNYFMVSLAVGDILLGMATMQSLMVIVVPADYWTTTCNTTGLSVPSTLLLITTVLAYLHILVITMDCFISILKPLHYHQLMSPKRAKIIIAVIWIVSLVLGSVYSLKEMYIYECRYLPILEMYRTLLKVVLWTMVVLAVIVMYWKIFAIVHKQKRQIQELSESFSNELNPENITYRDNKKGTKRIIMVFVIIIAFIVLWLPNMIASILLAFYLDILMHAMQVSTMMTFFVIGQTFAMLNSAVNVGIYATIDKDFRNAYRQVLRCYNNNW